MAPAGFPEPEHLRQHIGGWIKKHSEFAGLLPFLAALNFAGSGKDIMISFCHAYFADYYFGGLRAEMELALRKCLGNITIRYAETPLATPGKDNGSEPFADFFCSERNAPVMEAARHLCADSDHVCHFLILRGGSGTGKSHLLTTMARALGNLFSERAILRIQARFFNPAASPEAFWRRRRALLLDDLQEVIHDSERQRSISACIDFALAAPGFYRLVVACSGDISGFGPKLYQRLERGLLLNLHAADLAARIQYTELESRRLGLSLPKNRITLIARQIQEIPAIAGVLQKYKFFCKLGGPTFSHDMLADIAIPDRTSGGWQRILMLVADRLALKPAEILSKNRRQEFVLARHAAMFLCRVKLGLSYPELGRIFGGMDHSTVMHGIKKIQKLRASDSDMHKLLTELENELD